MAYEHVDSHQDKHKLWWHLTLEEQLNCVCDGLAKKAVHRSMTRLPGPEERYLLPEERAAVFVDGKKLTSEAGHEVRHYLGTR